ncbi:MAG: 2'-5' RNA ligase family protein [Chitinophagaceae bacterium]|nr:2'-5' RNA ligase family protein [Chitinophagaceae bacterium]
MAKKRIQLTLFIDEQDAMAIENIRRAFNPVQYALIKSHVTLCREDELEQISIVKKRLAALQHHSITISFGPLIRFSEGKGVLMPAAGRNEIFRQLRTVILQGITGHIRNHEPHITLMHPRNSSCTDELFEQLQTIKLPDQVTFKKISLIEQEAGNNWNVLEEFELIHAQKKFS